MHVNVFKSLDVQYRSRLMQCNVILCNVNNIELKTRGISKTHVTYGQVTFEQEFIIAEDINENCIIGIDIIRKQGFLIDGSDGTVSIKKKVNRMENFSPHGQFVCRQNRQCAYPVG